MPPQPITRASCWSLCVNVADTLRAAVESDAQTLTARSLPLIWLHRPPCSRSSGNTGWGAASYLQLLIAQQTGTVNPDQYGCGPGTNA
jgi:hypothetical protein